MGFCFFFNLKKIWICNKHTKSNITEENILNYLCIFRKFYAKFIRHHVDKANFSEIFENIMQKVTNIMIENSQFKITVYIYEMTLLSFKCINLTLTRPLKTSKTVFIVVLKQLSALRFKHENFLCR